MFHFSFLSSPLAIIISMPNASRRLAGRKPLECTTLYNNYSGDVKFLAVSPQWHTVYKKYRLRRLHSALKSLHTHIFFWFLRCLYGLPRPHWVRIKYTVSPGHVKCDYTGSDQIYIVATNASLTSLNVNKRHLRLKYLLTSWPSCPTYNTLSLWISWIIHVKYNLITHFLLHIYVPLVLSSFAFRNLN